VSAAVHHAAAADLLDAFPDRPLGLVRKAGDRRLRELAALALAFLGVAGVVGWLLLGEIALHRDLRTRGVATRILDWDRSCSTATWRTRSACSGTGTYAVRPEHGGGEREAWFVTYTPEFPVRVAYDPQDPDRVLAVQDLEDGYAHIYLVGTFIPLAFGLFLAWFAVSGFRREWRAVRARGRPVLIPVTSARAAGFEGKSDVYYTVRFRDPGSDDIQPAHFPGNVLPFLVERAPPAEPGALDVLALAMADGAIKPLDRDLSFLDLRDTEREAILGVADLPSPIEEPAPATPADPAPAPAPATAAPQPASAMTEVRFGASRWNFRRFVRRARKTPPPAPAPSSPEGQAAAPVPPTPAPGHHYDPKEEVVETDPRIRDLKDLADKLRARSLGGWALDLHLYAAIFGHPGPHGYQGDEPDVAFTDYSQYQNYSEPLWPVTNCPGFTSVIMDSELLIPGFARGSRSWRAEASLGSHHGQASYKVWINEEMEWSQGGSVPEAICLAALAYYAKHPDKLRRRGLETGESCVPVAEALIEKVGRKSEELEARRVAEGWTKDHRFGTLVPPGWVYARSQGES
jgi:hypothetical protein